MIKRPADIVPPPKSRPAVDTLNRDGAMALARRLQQYWHDQGYTAARFWAEPLDERFAKIGTYEVYQVKCNLVNGLPPRYRDENHWARHATAWRAASCPFGRCRESARPCLFIGAVGDRHGPGEDAGG
jgi:hypothetical protein